MITLNILRVSGKRENRKHVKNLNSGPNKTMYKAGAKKKVQLRKRLVPLRCDQALCVRKRRKTSWRQLSNQ